MDTPKFKVQATGTVINPEENMSDNGFGTIDLQSLPSLLARPVVPTPINPVPEGTKTIFAEDVDALLRADYPEVAAAAIAVNAAIADLNLAIARATVSEQDKDREALLDTIYEWVAEASLAFHAQLSAAQLVELKEVAAAAAAKHGRSQEDLAGLFAFLDETAPQLVN